MTEAKRNYEAVIGSLSDSQVEDDKTVTATGKVVRIAGEFDGNQMQYSMILDTNPNLIFTIGADKSAELALTKEGDTVLLTYAEQESGVVKANSFAAGQEVRDAHPCQRLFLHPHPRDRGGIRPVRSHPCIRFISPATERPSGTLKTRSAA